MKLPDLTDLELAGVHAWKGDAVAAEAGAGAAGLRFHGMDLAQVHTKSELLAALAKGLNLPEHFGSNWDAFADCVEDDDWFGRKGCVIALQHTAGFRKAHAADWSTFEDILGEAADYWRERHKPFWVFVS